MKFSRLRDAIAWLAGLIVLPPAHRHPLDAYAWTVSEAWACV
jgi:hypothetical protein